MYLLTSEESQILFYMSLSLTAKKETKETPGAGTPFAKQFYGSAQSSGLSVCDGKCNNQ